MRTVTEGLSPTFVAQPPPFEVPAFPMQPLHLEYLRSWVSRLVAQGSLAIAQRRPQWLIPVHCVPKVNGNGEETLRPVLDATIINAFVKPRPFVAEAINDLAQLVRPGLAGITYDCSDAYYSMFLGGQSTGNLGFTLDGVIYVFIACPMGWRLSAWGFNKLHRTLARYFRSRGHICSFFGDDGAILTTTVLARAVGAFAYDTIIACGLIPNMTKSNFRGSTLFEFIGFVICIVAMTIQLRRRRLNKVRALLAKLLLATRWSRKQVQKLTGQVMSSAYVVGDTCWLRSRALFHFVSQSPKHSTMVPHCTARQEVHFWCKLFMSSPTRQLNEVHQQPIVVTSTDASATGLGSFPLRYPQHPLPLEVSRPLTMVEQAYSSTLRELVGVLFDLQSNVLVYENIIVLYLVDNKGVLSIIRRGSKVMDLQKIAEEIVCICQRHGIVIR